MKYRLKLCAGLLLTPASGTKKAADIPTPVWTGGQSLIFRVMALVTDQLVVAKPADSAQKDPNLLDFEYEAGAYLVSRIA
jgi:hypothetical protein